MARRRRAQQHREVTGTGTSRSGPHLHFCKFVVMGLTYDSRAFLPLASSGFSTAPPWLLFFEIFMYRCVMLPLGKLCMLLASLRGVSSSVIGSQLEYSA